ncbi:hypothetical protein HPB52_010546 [Rhipicephalus sanguineus]|uniref:Uncharacterized protein n=1 Tax=Rhipicephalus sanguineus TaxID=34632 RepID=A0A9D4SMQ7_RHISA|nr:hypothetical protein HPB52_010546 [Rhipicephalus sanguineus]
MQTRKTLKKVEKELTLRLYDDAENIVQGDGVRCVVSIAYVSGIQVWNGGRAWLCGPLVRAFPSCRSFSSLWPLILVAIGAEVQGMEKRLQL